MTVAIYQPPSVIEAVDPIVHYMWWGNPATDQLAIDFSKTPNQLASLGGVRVHYWRNSADTMIGAQPAHGREYVLQAAGAWPARAELHDSIIVHEFKSTGDPTTERDGVTAANYDTPQNSDQ